MAPDVTVASQRSSRCGVALRLHGWLGHGPPTHRITRHLTVPKSHVPSGAGSTYSTSAPLKRSAPSALTGASTVELASSVPWRCAVPRAT